MEPGVADHKLVVASVHLKVPEEEAAERQVWCFAKANWSELRRELLEENWDVLAELSADEAEEHLTTRLLHAMQKHVPTRKLRERKCTQPWLTDEVLELVRKKHQAAGTPGETAVAKACSEALLKEYKA